MSDWMLVILTATLTTIVLNVVELAVKAWWRRGN